MKRFTALMLGTALAAALSFAQADKAPAKAKSTTATEPAATTAPVKVKKHKKHAKKSATPATPAAPAASATPATPAAPAHK